MSQMDKKRVALAFALTLTVALGSAIAAAGLRGVTRAVVAVDSILAREAKLVEHASGLEASTLNLRRYEKDVFLNIADEAKVAEYFTKWKATHDFAVEHLAELRKLGGAEEARAVAAMNEDLAAYAAGFEGVMRGIGSGTVDTPEAANGAMGAYEDRIRSLNTRAQALAAKSLRRMRAKGSVVTDAGERTRAVMWAICIAGIAIVWVVTIFVARGGTGPTTGHSSRAAV